jgi:putative thiamine transport system permease protein
MEMIRFAAGCCLILLGLPVAAGITGTVLPAFGYAPALGFYHFSLEPFRQLLDMLGFWSSLKLTLITGICATALSLFLASCCCALWIRRPFFQNMMASLAPFLAIPHAALAIGLGFLIAPSGLLVRFAASLMGWQVPPDFTAPQDPYGLSLILGLVAKEVPYLLVMMAAALHPLKAHELMKAAMALGYHPITAFFKAVLPILYPRICLPVYAVLAFSLSNVESALLLGPGNPSVLSVLAHRWFSDYDLAFYRPAAAASVFLLLIILVMIGLWHGTARLVQRAAIFWAEGGQRSGTALFLARFGACQAGFIMMLFIVSFISLALWSLASLWRFPDLWPASLTLDHWVRLSAGLFVPFSNTLIIACLSGLMALIVSLVCLETQVRNRRAIPFMAILYTSLLIPPVAFLSGLQNMLLRFGLEGTYSAVIFIHVIFVVPYVFLSLSGPFLKLNLRYRHVSASLGSSPSTTFVKVVMPMLIRPVLISFAIGFAISAGLYLPTLYAGAGRITTLTTEAVSLASGLDRRVMGVYAFAQAALPCLVYGFALLYPLRLKRS